MISLILTNILEENYHIVPIYRWGHGNSKEVKNMAKARQQKNGKVKNRVTYFILSPLPIEVPAQEGLLFWLKQTVQLSVLMRTNWHRDMEKTQMDSRLRKWKRSPPYSLFHKQISYVPIQTLSLWGDHWVSVIIVWHYLLINNTRFIERWKYINIHSFI